MNRPMIAATLALFTWPIEPGIAADQADWAERRAIAIVKQRHLLKASELACLHFYFDGKKNGVFSVTVREKHGGGCGGDPDVEPRRFTMEFGAKGGPVRWDNNIDRDMRPIP